MRRLVKPARLGATVVEALRINPKSRDDIEYVLRGLQRFYVNCWMTFSGFSTKSSSPMSTSLMVVREWTVGEFS